MDVSRPLDILRHMLSSNDGESRAGLESHTPRPRELKHCLWNTGISDNGLKYTNCSVARRSRERTFVPQPKSLLTFITNAHEPPSRNFQYAPPPPGPRLSPALEVEDIATPARWILSSTQRRPVHHKLLVFHINYGPAVRLVPQFHHHQLVYLLWIYS